MKNIKDLVVHKPNELIELEGGYLTTLKYATYNFILLKLQEEGKNYINLSLSEVFSKLEISKNYDDFIQYLDDLQKIRVVSKDKKGKLWGAFYLLSAFKKNEDGTFFIEIPYAIYKSLCEKDNLYYTTIKLLEQKSFKCIYSGLFYEIFKKYEKINIPIFTLDELKKMTGTLEKYKEYKDFKRYVLIKSLKEINDTDKKYTYTFEELRLGRKIDKIKFIKSFKENEKPQLVLPDLSEKLLSAIENVKKNRFIKEKYSQKSVDKAITQFGEDLVVAGLMKLYSFEGKVSYFSSLLNSTIKDIQRDEEVNKLKKEKTIKKEEVITPAVEVPKSIERETITESEFEKRYKQFLEEKQVEDTEHTRICYRFAFNIIKD